ncbi:hypothetical protein ACFQ0M_40925 [Kitasatospora aburaviensis]
MLSGDWIPVPLPDAIRAAHPGARVISLGGATEASIWSISFPIGEVPPHWSRIPYGKPLANQTMHVLDHRLDPARSGRPARSTSAASASPRATGPTRPGRPRASSTTP